MTFADPWWLVFLAVPVAILVAGLLRFARGNKAGRGVIPAAAQVAISVSSGAPWIESWRKATEHRRVARVSVRVAVLLPLFLRVIALAMVVIALARPQSGPRGKNRSVDGLDIQLVIDTSGSMRAQDFQLGGERPTRLAVVKAVIEDFIAARTDDRIGLVVFGTEAFTQAPLTLDHQLLREFLKHIEVSMAGDSTAIGDGLATAVKRLEKKSENDDMAATAGKGRIVILLTDGANNAGRIDPLTAAEAAKALGIRVYTIGVGSRGKVPMQVNGRMVEVEVDIDEALLEKIAQATGGRFYRATDTRALVEVYGAIDKLEKSRGRAPVREVRRELYANFLWPALMLLVCDVLFGLTRRKVIPG